MQVGVLGREEAPPGWGRVWGPSPGREGSLLSSKLG